MVIGSRWSFAALAVLLVSCDSLVPLRPPPYDAGMRRGCPTHPPDAPLALDGEDIGYGWDHVSPMFFEVYCTSCHSRELTGPSRNEAPEGYDWDDPASVREHREIIRRAVGETNFMPPTFAVSAGFPEPSCDERE